MASCCDEVSGGCRRLDLVEDEIRAHQRGRRGKEEDDQLRRCHRTSDVAEGAIGKVGGGSVDEIHGGDGDRGVEDLALGEGGDRA